MTLARDKDAWTLADRGGYPAKAEAVRALLVKLAEAELVESKTRNKDRYALLELEDPAAKDAKSRLLRLLDDKGGVIAEAIVGKKRFDAFGGSKSGTYVRKPGDAQTWLTNADLDVSAGRAGLGASRACSTCRGQDRQGDDRDPRRGAAGDRARCGRRQQVRAGRHARGQEAERGRRHRRHRARGRRRSSWRTCASRRPAPRRRAMRASSRSRPTAGSPSPCGCARRARTPGSSLEATGAEGDAKKTADEITKRTQGWEFKVPAAKAQSILKRRADLFEAS